MPVEPLQESTPPGENRMLISSFVRTLLATGKEWYSVLAE